MYLYWASLTLSALLALLLPWHITAVDVRYEHSKPPRGTHPILSYTDGHGTLVSMPKEWTEKYLQTHFSHGRVAGWVAVFGMVALFPLLSRFPLPCRFHTGKRMANRSDDRF
ncbi:hypothetical protein EJ04DRAFT_514223 [Polyplosphaeria fusca]|uniref:Uncharacterized protein n=1 Tax=Polyplosphaeria fusca TaxID=682080 RepID=A0A9P4V094_9PLEO|nr:hypothetical protein EJ04DRAFT_514223 [Polyplosphaeria fusca]